MASGDDMVSIMEIEDDEMKMGKDSEMELDMDKEKDKVNVIPDAPQDNPRKRKANLAPLQNISNDQLTETLSTMSQALPPEETIDIFVKKGGEVIRKNKRRVWRKSNKDYASVGIMREPVKI